MYLLDTNAIIRFANRSSVRVTQHINESTQGSLFVSTITIGELFFGAFNSSRRDKNYYGYIDLMAQFAHVDFDYASAEEYGRLRAFLKSTGQLIGGNDMFIAATALAHDLTLITANTREFERIPRLRIENWEV